MKILNNLTDRDFVNGLKFAAEQCGHQWINLDRSPFDIFDEEEPDLFIGGAEALSRGILSCIQETEIPSLLYCRPDHLPPFDLITKFRKQTNTDPILFNFGSKDIAYEDEFRIFSVMRAADMGLVPRPDQDEEKYVGDISYVGDHHRHLTPYILPLCWDKIDELPDRPNVKIYGDGWPVPQCLGRISYRDQGWVYKNSLICPNVQVTSDQEINGRIFNILTSEGFCISSEIARDVFGDSIPTYNSPANFIEVVREFYSERGTGKRESLMEEGRELVLRQHTYFHRLSQIFQMIGMNRLSDHALEVYSATKGF